jgi:hypothetical protein
MIPWRDLRGNSGVQTTEVALRTSQSGIRKRATTAISNIAEILAF